VTLAHHLDLKVIAEGIETRGQQSYLEQFGCEFGQGYLYSKPIDHHAFEKLLAAAPRTAEEPAADIAPRRVLQS
jgi:EAL domain-containing protein (putative c-di-GMP-specific phosphodiesterase class I)